MNLKEVIALITLLDDPDENIYSQVKERFIMLGPPAIPHLETAWENSFDMLMQKRIEGIIHNINFEALNKALRNWAEHEQEDLFKGMSILARYQYPDLDEAKLKKQLHFGLSLSKSGPVSTKSHYRLRAIIYCPVLPMKRCLLKMM